MTNGNENYTVKEILTQFILPNLEEINKKLDNKAEATDVGKLEERVEDLAKATAELPATITKVHELEKQLTTPEKIGQMIDEGLRASKARGWTNKERLLGAAVGLMTLFTLVLNLVANK